MLRGRRLLGVGIAVLALSVPLVVGSSLEGGRARRIAAEARRSARYAATVARDALGVQGESVAVLAHNANTNVPLVAALRGRVDRRTLSDLFATESWWQPYRALGTAVSFQGTKLAFAQPGMAELPLGPLIEAVRADGQPVSRPLVGGG